MDFLIDNTNDYIYIDSYNTFLATSPDNVNGGYNLLLPVSTQIEDGINTNMHVNDFGLIFKTTIVDESGSVINVGSSNSSYFKFKKPDGSFMQKNPYLFTDGSDGILAYSVQSGDINQIGLWSFQAQITFSGKSYHTNISNFRVERNL